MSDCKNCKYAEFDYFEYYGTDDKNWFVSDCKLDNVPMNAAECEDFKEYTEELGDGF